MTAACKESGMRFALNLFLQFALGFAAYHLAPRFPNWIGLLLSLVALFAFLAFPFGIVYAFFRLAGRKTQNLEFFYQNFPVGAAWKALRVDLDADQWIPQPEVPPESPEERAKRISDKRFRAAVVFLQIVAVGGGGFWVFRERPSWAAGCLLYPAAAFVAFLFLPALLTLFALARKDGNAVDAVRATSSEPGRWRETAIALFLAVLALTVIGPRLFYAFLHTDWGSRAVIFLLLVLCIQRAIPPMHERKWLLAALGAAPTVVVAGAAGIAAIANMGWMSGIVLFPAIGMAGLLIFPVSAALAAAFTKGNRLWSAMGLLAAAPVLAFIVYIALDLSFSACSPR